MAEISNPALQRKGLRLCLAAALADGHLAEGENFVAEAARHEGTSPWCLIGVDQDAFNGQPR